MVSPDVTWIIFPTPGADAWHGVAAGFPTYIETLIGVSETRQREDVPHGSPGAEGGHSIV
jgi:hypothetical protein